MPDSMTIRPGIEFAADCYIHVPLADDAPLDPRSAVWVMELQRQIATFYGTPGVNTHEYTPTLFIVGPNEPTRPVKAEDINGVVDPNFGSALERMWNPVPIPVDFQASLGTDMEAIIYQPSTGKYWEFWQMQPSGRTVLNSLGASVPEWRATWGGKMDNIAANRGFWEPYTEPGGGLLPGTQAAGLPSLSSIMTIQEQRAGVINHPLNLVIVQARAGYYALPAQRTDGGIVDVNAIPEGIVFRLPASLDLAAIDMDPYARMLAKAVQKYGMIVSDTGGAVQFRGENPANRYAIDPYYGTGGIFQIVDCPTGCTQANAPASCWPSKDARLRGFPWDQLQAVKPSGFMIWNDAAASYIPE